MIPFLPQGQHFILRESKVLKNQDYINGPVSMATVMNEPSKVTLEMAWMRSGPLPWRCAEWRGPTSKATSWNGTVRMKLCLFSTRLQKYILIKLMIHPIPPLCLPPLLHFLLQLNPGSPGLLQILQGHSGGCSFTTGLLPWATLVLLWPTTVFLLGPRIFSEVMSWWKLC